MTQAATKRHYDGTVALDAMAEIVALEREATRAEAAWKARKEELRAVLEKALGDNEAGTIAGRVVVTHSLKATWARERFVRENPDLAAAYTHEITEEKLDWDALRAAYPEIAKQYQVRAFGSTYEG